LAVAGASATAVDLGCSEGWFAHKLLDWGASRVIGIDARSVNIRRAELIRDHYGISARRLEYRVGNILALRPEQLGTFDVVLCLGLIYHLENPVGALRVARGLTGGVCLVETQASVQPGPSRYTWGTT